MVGYGKRPWIATFGPFKFAEICLVQHEKRFHHSVLRYWLQFFLHGLQTHFKFESAPQLIFAASREEMLLTLLHAGFPLEIIPKHLGGPWSYSKQVDEWMAWLAKRDDERNQRVLMSQSSSSSSSLFVSPTPATNNNKPTSCRIVQAVDYRKHNVDH